ncbi:MAG: hypothetical protein VYD19_07240, partial [Myxococcota bacterium]|nr:hypothetical protein [Myxococcota bacterium]
MLHRASLSRISVLLTVAFALTQPNMTHAVERCDATQVIGPDTRACRYHADVHAVVDINSLFRYWVRLGLGGQPVGDITLPQVEASVIKPDGTRVCAGSYPQQRVIKSVLSIDLDARIQCSDGRSLRDNFARYPALALRLCPAPENCLRPARFGAVPYALKAQFASWVQRASYAEQAAVAEYAHRILANRADLLGQRISKGFFSLITSNEDGSPGDETATFLWSPVSPQGGSLQISGKDHRLDQSPAPDQLISLHSLVLAAVETTIRGTLTIDGFDEDEDGQAEGLRVTGPVHIDGPVTVSTGVDTATILRAGVAFSGLLLEGQLEVDENVANSVAGNALLGYGVPAPALGLQVDRDLQVNADAEITGRLRVIGDGRVAGESEIGGALLQPASSLVSPVTARLTATSLEVGDGVVQPADSPESLTLAGPLTGATLRLPPLPPGDTVLRLQVAEPLRATEVQSSTLRLGAAIQPLLQAEGASGSPELGAAGEDLVIEGPVRFERPVTLPDRLNVTVNYQGCVIENVDGTPIAADDVSKRSKVRIRCANDQVLEIPVFNCGDGELDLGEQCDDGNLIDGDNCDQYCLCECFGEPGCECRADTCGDGEVDDKEECEDNDFDNNDACINCQDAECGDGFLWSTEGGVEGCDDGNVVDGDGCRPDCTVQAGWSCINADPSFCCEGNVLIDTDRDRLCDDLDDDDDNDGVVDLHEVTCLDDAARLNAAIQPQDSDGDGLCDNGIDSDDDNDGRDDLDDSDPLNQFICADTDGDGCDDCNSGRFDPENDTLRPDGTVCVGGAPGDRDGDGFSDADETTCGSNPSARGLTPLDTDGDGLCDNGVDPDDDNDGVVDADDNAPLNRNACRDVDGDTCDDCSSGSDDPSADGLDTDGDGDCNAGD